MAVATSERGIYHSIPPEQEGRKPIWHEMVWSLELGELLTNPVFRGEGVPPGDRSAAIIIPGYLSNDFHTRRLRDWIDRMGYIAHPSDITIANIDPEASEGRLLSKVDEAYSATGKRVHLIGHSIGGIMARVIAARRAEKVRSVTTLGSPLFGEPEEIIAPTVLKAAEWSIPILRNRRRLEQRKQEISESLLHKGVRMMSVYTRRDGVVDWRYCVDQDLDTENVEVEGTHAGLIFNSQVYSRLGRFLSLPQLGEIKNFPASSKVAA